MLRACCAGAVRVLAHNETPGLGDKIELKKSSWIDSFVGKFLNRDNEASWAVKKMAANSMLSPAPPSPRPEYPRP